MKPKYYIVFRDAGKTTPVGVIGVRHGFRGLYHEYRVNTHLVEWQMSHNPRRITSIKCDVDEAKTFPGARWLRYSTDIGIPENCVSADFIHRRCIPIGGPEIGAQMLASGCGKLVEWLQPQLYEDIPIGNIYHPDFPPAS